MAGEKGVVFYSHSMKKLHCFEGCFLGSTFNVFATLAVLVLKYIGWINKRWLNVAFQEMV